MENKRVLIIDDNDALLDSLEARLTHAGFVVYTCAESWRALETIREVTPDLILLDIVMPGIDGFSIKEELNRDVKTASIPVIFLTANHSVPDKVKGLRCGVDDYITKPFNPRELVARIEAVLDRREFYETIAMKDALTGLYNVHYFEKQMALFFNMARRYGKVFSMAIVDIDDFKRINDEYGHLAGDFLLKQFSASARRVCRETDIIIRYGGDEFIIIMPETGDAEAISVIEKLKRECSGCSFALPHSNVEITFSISAGLVTYEDFFETGAQMFDVADKRLYREKSGKQSLHPAKTRKRTERSWFHYERPDEIRVT